MLDDAIKKFREKSLQQIKISFQLSRYRIHEIHVLNHKVTYALDYQTINFMSGTWSNFYPASHRLIIIQTLSTVSKEQALKALEK